VRSPLRRPERPWLQPGRHDEGQLHFLHSIIVLDPEKWSLSTYAYTHMIADTCLHTNNTSTRILSTLFDDAPTYLCMRVCVHVYRRLMINAPYNTSSMCTHASKILHTFIDLWVCMHVCLRVCMSCAMNVRMFLSLAQKLTVGGIELGRHAAWLQRGRHHGVGAHALGEDDVGSDHVVALALSLLRTLHEDPSYQVDDEQQQTANEYLFTRVHSHGHGHGHGHVLVRFNVFVCSGLIFRG